MQKRLTWEEIKTQYPDQWVGLSRIEWNGAEPNVRSAVVTYAGPSNHEALQKQIAGEDVYTVYTTPDNLCPLGILAGAR